MSYIRYAPGGLKVIIMNKHGLNNKDCFNFSIFFGIICTIYDFVALLFFYKIPFLMKLRCSR